MVLDTKFCELFINSFNRVIEYDAAFHLNPVDFHI